MRKIIVFDQTIREGMQYRGLMFSYAERLKIMEFQHALGVDISQVGYPPAHESEIRHIKKICYEASRRNYNFSCFPALNRMLE
jgi:2-isopropylmalate synthase